MIDVLNEPSTSRTGEVDRPAWIPSDIVADWDTSPYAYQTEEELMSQGPLHDLLMTYLSQVMPNHLAKFGLILWKDLFLLYRDEKNIKRRIGPDLMLASKDLALLQGSWDLDSLPVPEFIGEITSPDSRRQDLETKRELYHQLGVKRYLIIDGHKKGGKVSGVIKCRIWNDNIEQKPDADGFLDLPELQAAVKVEDTDLVIYDLQTKLPLPDMADMEASLAGMEEKNISLVEENVLQAARIAELEKQLKKSQD